MFKHLKGVQPPTAWDPSVLADSALRQLLKGRFIFLDDSQAGHNDMEMFFPKAKVIIDCNANTPSSVRRKASGVYISLDKNEIYNKLDKKYEAAMLDVFSVEGRTKMLKSLVPLVQQTLMDGNDVIFHDKVGQCLCVIAGAAVQKGLTGQQLHVSDDNGKFCWIELSAQSQD